MFDLRTDVRVAIDPDGFKGNGNEKNCTWENGEWEREMMTTVFDQVAVLFCINIIL